MRVRFLFGPNLGRLGTRDPDRYGTETLEQIIERRVRHLTAYQDAAYARTVRVDLDHLELLVADEVPGAGGEEAGGDLELGLLGGVARRRRGQNVADQRKHLAFLIDVKRVRRAAENQPRARCRFREAGQAGGPRRPQENAANHHATHVVQSQRADVLAEHSGRGVMPLDERRSDRPAADRLQGQGAPGRMAKNERLTAGCADQGVDILNLHFLPQILGTTAIPAGTHALPARCGGGGR